MRAICRTKSFGVELKDIPIPEATPEHVIVKICACGVNPGDKGWIAGLFPDAPASMYDVCGATASGVVIDVGEGVPKHWLGKKVALYRSLKASNDCVGTWCEIARMHYLTCALLPDDVDEVDYSGSLVNNITGVVFLNQIIEAGHKAVVCTAGTSATGRSLLAACQARKFPIISLVRNEDGRTALSKLGAQHVLATDSADCDAELKRLSVELNATAVFDGVGGALLGRIAKLLRPGATVYCYGFLGGNEPLSFPSVLLLLNSLTLTSFGIFYSPLVKNADSLKHMLSEVQGLVGLPHCRTSVGKTWGFERVSEALQWNDEHGSRAVLKP